MGLSTKAMGKTSMTRGKKILLFGILLIGVLFQYNCGGGGGGSGAVNEPPSLTGTIVSKAASLSGSEEVPPVTTGAGGSGILDVSTTTGAVRGSVTLQTSPVTAVIAVHVHEGARGENGGIVIALVNSGSGVWSVPSDKVLTTAQVNSFLAGNFYFNVRTDANPNGELRGQIDQ